MDARGIIGNYIVERELGRGGMGVVYAAKHRVLGRPAAIKLLLANTSDDRGRVERFFNEARAAMAIDHPGVVKIYDVGISAENHPYIAMELLDGTSLASLVAPAGLPIRQGIDYACQIASALAAAHDAGVIHRDLKPENIIITRDRSRAIVVDFGIAKLAHQATVRTATGALVGTPLYMSPEQCEGLRDLDARSDLYAFGCVIFAMLTGRPPFFEGGTGGLIGMHLHVAPPPLRSRCANASEALERLVSVLLAKSPEARFRTARAALAALQAPEVRGIAVSSSDVPATADIVQGNRSVQPWAATPAVGAPPAHVARDAPTMGTGVIAPSPHAPPHAPHPSGMAPHASGSSGGTPAPHASSPLGSAASGSMGPHASGSLAPGTAFGVPASRDAWTQVTGADFRDPRTAAVQAVGTPSPSSSVVGSMPVGSMPSAVGSMSSNAMGPSSVNAMGPSNAMGGSWSGAGQAHAMTQPGSAPVAQQSRKKMIIAIVASSALTAIIAIGASRGCGGSGGTNDAGVAVGSGSGTNAASNLVAIGDGTAPRGGSAAQDPRGTGSTQDPGKGTDPSTRDADGTNAAGKGTDAKTTDPNVTTRTTDPDATTRTTDPKATTRTTDPKATTRTTDPKATTRTTEPKATARTTDPKGTPKTTPPKDTTRSNNGSVQIDPNGGPLPGARPRNEVPGAGLANLSDEEREKAQAQEPAVRHEIRDYFLFAKGDFGASMGQRALDRVAANHRLDPTRRIIITGHAEQDEPGSLDNLAGARANTAYTHLLSRGVKRGVLVMSSTRFIDPATPNGANRRVDIHFE